MLQKMSAYRRDFGETKYISLRKGGEWLEKYDKNWVKISNSMKKGFDSEPVYNEKHLKTKVKFRDWNISVNFHGYKVPKEGFQHICLWVILIDFVFRTARNYHLQVFLEEYIVKKKEILKHITGDLEISSDEENFTGKSSDKGSSYKELEKHQDNFFFEGAIFDVFLREKFCDVFFEEQFWECFFCMLRKQFVLKNMS